jgi:heparan-alpha-glucosaminide N-acetyltransferase
MNATAQVLTGPSMERAASARIASIDIFRGLTMVVMIFVNDLASVQGLPWWTYHAPAKADLMTYVDMVFPLFLFIVGMSIPIAIERRLKKNPSILSLWKHIVLRSFSLLVLGLILANAEKGDATRMGINSNVWAVLGLSGGVLLWGIYSGNKIGPKLLRFLHLLGFTLLVVTFAIFRRTTHDGHVAWIDNSYPEILGLIAYTYLAVCILYVPTSRWKWAPGVFLIALTALCTLSTANYITFTHHLPLYFWPFGNGAMAALTMAGVVTSQIFLGSKQESPLRKKFLLAIVFAVAALIAGYLLTPLGISKIRATPTWTFYCIGAGVLIFAALYWVCDIKRSTRWAFFAHPAGANTLLTYLLPDFYYFITAAAGLMYLDTRFNHGRPGVMRSILFTGCILAMSALLTKWKIRMQL